MAGEMIAASLLPSILSIIGIQDYKGMDNNLKSKLTDFAQQLIDKWQTKQQESSYSPDFQSSSLPNRNQLQALMYQEFANETRKLHQDIQQAQMNDAKNWDKNRGWYMLQDGIGGVIKLASDINPMGWAPKIGYNLLEKYDSKHGTNMAGQMMGAFNKINATDAKYKARNKNLLKVKKQAEQLQAKQKATMNKFNDYIIQSRDRFGRNNDKPRDYKSHSDTMNIKLNGTNERNNRETKF